MDYDGSIKIDTSVNTNTFNKNMNKLADIAKTALNTVLTSVTAVSAALVGIAAKSLSVGMGFEESMSKVSALSGATGDNLEKLSDKAKELGSNTRYSATEVSEALSYMALAGWDTEQMLNGVDGVINLAIASGENLASVSDIVTDSLTAFGMTARDTNKFVDILTKTSTKSNTTVGMLGESFKYIAPVCGAMGYSVEDAAIALGLMANSGIKSSQSGTSLRMALSKMAKPTDDAAGAMEKLGISLTDGNGNMLSLMEIMQQLRKKIGSVDTEIVDADGNLRDYDDIIKDLSKDTDNLTQIEQLKTAATIFGTESMSGMLAIINATEEDFASLTSEVYNYNGACETVAKTMSDNLAGDIASLKSAIEGLEIAISERFKDSLRNAAAQGVDYVNRLKEAFVNGGLNEAVNEAGQIFAEFVSKAVEYAPKMVDASISFIQSFVGAVIEHKNEIISSAKVIALTLANGLIKLLPEEVQEPIRTCIHIIKQSFENGGLKEVIDTIKNIFKKIGDIVKNLTKTILPPLAIALDKVAGSVKVLLPMITTMYATWKAFTILKAVNTMLKQSAIATTAEALATANSNGQISIKNVLLALLQKNISLATAKTYLLNAALGAGVIGIAVTAVTALATAFGSLWLTSDDTTNSVDNFNDSINETNGIFEEVQTSIDRVNGILDDYKDKVNGATSLFSNFNDEIVISAEKQEELENKMKSVQTEITNIAGHYTNERRNLTDSEIKRLEELFDEMEKLAEQQTKIQEAYQQANLSYAQSIAGSTTLSDNEYIDEMAKIEKTAQETLDKAIDTISTQRTAEIVLANQTGKSQEEINNILEKYKTMTAEAEKVYADTISIVAQSYFKNHTVIRDCITKIEKAQYERTKISVDNTKEYLNFLESEYKKHQKEVDAYLELEAGVYEAEGRILDTATKEFKRNEYLRLNYQEEFNQYFEYRNEKMANANLKVQEAYNNETLQNEIALYLDMIKEVIDKGGILDRKNIEIYNRIKSIYEKAPAEFKAIFGDAIDGINDKIKGQLSEMAAETKEEVENLIKNIIQGLNSAFDNGTFGTFANVGANLANAFFTGFRKAAGIASPSKVMKRLFGYVVEGGIVGIDSKKSSLLSSAYTVANDTANTIKKRLEQEDLAAKLKAGGRI